MTEKFRPVAHHPPDNILNTLKFYGRLTLDFQTLTIYKYLNQYVPAMKGKVLDIGCGNSPFKFLVNAEQCKYTGIDIAGADNFDYQNEDIVVFDGENIPFTDEYFENIICTEVIEHIAKPEKIIAEMHRVLKPGGLGIVTLPWSARVHFAPYDFCRYTPHKLAQLFKQFSKVNIQNRGTDINTIVSKMIVMFFGNLLTWDFSLKDIVLMPFKFLLLLLLLPILAVAVIFSHIALILKLGSTDDPLGYTIIFNK
ncbi:bifunctional 2-polyprenyl-6-hydroxyphenol methylase/3-demethylubiquinol 3-O-methyltransferase UbiG [Emticicia sp. BO119]|uniref:class I SAM-dependent methyltransferase n=1 Tax=Emticicia sp. BO119 TaxID=2757768 RepID=UPI0015F0E6AB|nr:class I SAM-dependent methyltransferase [Emticicia sp. BO119]MBA4851016.1 class I SAM-dependent methyltransferase [Emticicia sp. BO119]